MRYLVVSDMHANWQAFEVVLAAHPPADFDRVLVLGDLVGYGARPNEVVEAVRSLPDGTLAVRGNHDKVVAGLASDELFNPVARRAIHWTTTSLTPENLRHLRDLPAGPAQAEPDLEICHGTPHDEDAYVLAPEEALDSLESSRARLVLFGHTHVACVFDLDGERMEMRWGMDDGDAVDLVPGKRYLMNPGSVGQPRDGDARAACMTLDTTACEAVWHRHEYPVERAQRDILEAGLPEFLAQRLASGA